MLYRWVKERLAHKLEHLKWSNIKSTMKEHGLALVVIIVGWEIIEDVVFPLLFVLLGNHVHPALRRCTSLLTVVRTLVSCADPLGMVDQLFWKRP